MHLARHFILTQIFEISLPLVQSFPQVELHCKIRLLSDDGGSKPVVTPYSLLQPMPLQSKDSESAIDVRTCASLFLLKCVTQTNHSTLQQSVDDALSQFEYSLLPYLLVCFFSRALHWFMIVFAHVRFTGS